MIERILEALKRLEIAIYEINESKKESLECFFIKKKLDLKRRADLTDYRVTVYQSFQQDGQKMLGSSAALLHPGMNQNEMEEALKEAYQSAALVCNPYYELISGKKEDFVPSASGFAEHKLEENMNRMASALFAADQSQSVWINSAEIFAERILWHIVNSSGVDVNFETCQVTGEYIVQCAKPQDVETYHHFSYREPDTESLQHDVEEALSMTQARAEAVAAPKAGEYAVILSGKQMRILFDYYLGRSDSAMIYQKYSNYEVGTAVQGDQVKGDFVTVILKAKNPYSGEGIHMKDRALIEEGTLKLIHGGAKYGYYLEVEPTGEYGCIAVPTGETPMDQLKSQPYLHVVSFSDFQMDDLSGYFGGEIRLAFLYDGKTVTPVTGGSINGSILEVQNRMTFSKERYADGNYEGPFAVRIEGVKVAGE